MSSRDQVLDSIRRQQVVEVAHPGGFEQGIVYDDPVSQFQTVLAGIGGRAEPVASAAAATSILETIGEYTDAAKAWSGVDGIGRSTFDLAVVDDQHDLQDVDFAVLPGELAVAENGAVWVTTPDVMQRTLYFLIQHLALVVPRSRVVSNLHQAYEQVDVAKDPFGTWLSGPSKTADIEQSLVKGAHGSRTLIVFLVDDAARES